MAYTIGQLAQSLGAEIQGDKTIEITSAAEPASAAADQLAMAMSPKFAQHLGQGNARAAMLWVGADWQAMGLEAAILVARPRLAMAGLTQILDPGQGEAPGIHPTAVIDPSATLGDDLSIGPFVCIGARTKIGSNSVIGAGCVIGADVELGQGSYLRDQVSIGARARIGDRFMAQSGTRIGCDGFSFVTPETSAAEEARNTMADQTKAKPQSYVRIHSLGAVVIGDDVEIGANCTIDNGTIRNTEIGNGTKMDNMVHIGHNCRIGTDCLLCGQSGLSGSVDLGNFVILGGQSGVTDNVFVADRAIISGATKVLSNVPEGRIMMGYPAVKMDLHTAIYKAQRRLPRILRDVAELKKAVFKQDSKD